MSDAFWMSFFSFLATAVLAILQYRLGLKVQHASKKIEEVRHATNSLTDRLVETTRTEAFAAGVKDEKDRSP